jgi:hypothetical protein
MERVSLNWPKLVILVGRWGGEGKVEEDEEEEGGERERDEG